MAKIIDIIMPDSDQEGTELVLENWFKQVGDRVDMHEPIIEINTDKVSLEVPSPAAGILKEILKQPNEPVEPGDVLGRLELTDTAAASSGETTIPEKKQERATTAPATTSGNAATKLSPGVRRLLKKFGITANDIAGSGKDGRILIGDIEAYVKSGGKTVSAPPKPAPITAPAFGGDMPSRMVPHNALRRNTAAHMVESMLRTAPHVTAIFDADMSAVLAHRRRTKPAFADRDVNLTLTAYFIDATVKALQAVPEVNSRWHDDALEIFNDHNIGIAAAVDGGLIVPVIHRCQQLNLFGIAQRLQEVTEKARTRKLSRQDVEHGTFTITNHGMTGSLVATPIINQPQSAILGIGKLEKRVVVVEKDGQDATMIKPMVYVTLTIDHRALDGFQANQFLNRFVESLQEW